MICKLPTWFNQDIPDNATLERGRLLSEYKVSTVCQEAKCPNLSFCFKNLRFTFMILGDTCTRNCRFCAVKKSNGGPLEIDLEEPFRIAEVVKKLALNYVVITSVTRDDLEDGGARIFVDTIVQIRKASPKTRIELLIPDFKAEKETIKTIADSRPLVLGHNLETVKRLYHLVRPQADYGRSLQVLKIIKELDPAIIIKSALMLGLGENKDELGQAMLDLKMAGCDILVLGQYLRPSVKHYPVKEFISPERFAQLAGLAKTIGFAKVLSGPKMRSSYQAFQVYQEISYA